MEKPIIPTKKEKLTSFKQRINKRNLLTAFAISAALGSTVGFFSPADIYLAGQSDLFLPANQMFTALFLFSVFLTTVLCLILCIMLTVSEKAYLILRDLMLGSLITMYAQMLFFNGSLELMTGDGMIYTGSEQWKVINFIIFIEILPLPLYFRLFNEKKANNNSPSKEKSNDTDIIPYQNEKKTAKIYTYISLMLIVVQISGTISTAFRFGIDTDKSEINHGYFSYKEASQLSGKNNVIVFLTDKFDGSYMDKMLYEYPEVSDIFEGFTYYRDNISVYSHTFPSVPSMLLGHEYKGENVGDFLSASWKNDNILKNIKDNGGHINLLIDAVSTYNDANDVIPYADNYILTNDDYSTNYIGEHGVVRTMLKLSMVKLMPYYLKDLFSNMLNGWNVKYFFTLENSEETNQEQADKTVSTVSDKAFYDYLHNNGLSIDENADKCFTFIHLRATHDFGGVLSDIVTTKPVSGNVDSVIKVGRGVTSAIDEYFQEMKRLGIYDNSTIIIVADHGVKSTSVQKPGQKINDKIMSLLIIKEPNAERKPLVTDETTPMSNSYFSASVLDYLNIPYTQYGVSYHDVVKDDLSLPRDLTIFCYEGSTIPPSYVCNYRIEGCGLDFANWHYIFDESKVR